MKQNRLFPILIVLGMTGMVIHHACPSSANTDTKTRAATETVVTPTVVLGGVVGREVVDKIVARVNGRNILLSDLRLPRIDKEGGIYSIEEAIDHELLFQRASERKLLAKPIDIEKYILAWKEMHQLTHMTEQEFEERLLQDGLTGNQYRFQLARILAIRNLRQIEVNEQVVVSPHEVELYHEQNPEYSEDRYLLQTKIVKDVKDKKTKWIDLDWIDRSQLAEKMAFVADMSEGAVSEPIKVDQGYQFVKLLKKEKKHLKTLEERWVLIERVLQKQKMEGFEKKYVEGLKEKAPIVYL
ncbi:hypothetical protein KKA53_00910 [Candidatus Dependentiae bacterium]|nr:hypothetical protein [Candidatus Dependentiae bacterium]